MPGAPDPLYVLARRVLLDALEALGEQRAAITLVGAQAIYIHTGDADLAVAATTTDADIAVDPGALLGDPKLAEAMTGGGFVADPQDVGRWTKQVERDGELATVAVDLMVPEAVADPTGRRAARLGEHGDRTARKAKGLEAALVDRETATVTALEDTDPRAFEVAVAGPGALLVAKLHKIWERIDAPRGQENKDALDVLRLMRGVPMERIASILDVLLTDALAADVTREAIGFLKELFSTPTGRGSRMAADAAAGLVVEDTIVRSCAALASELLDALDHVGPETRP